MRNYEKEQKQEDEKEGEGEEAGYVTILLILWSIFFSLLLLFHSLTSGLMFLNIRPDLLPLCRAGITGIHRVCAPLKDERGCMESTRSRRGERSFSALSSSSSSLSSDHSSVMPCERGCSLFGCSTASML